MKRPIWFHMALHTGMVFLVILAVVSLAACQTLPEGPSARPARLCEPLPVCNIPASSTSSQLEEALWSCVVEYRAMYSVCKWMQEAE
jgi:hypothetical protein